MLTFFFFDEESGLPGVQQNVNIIKYVHLKVEFFIES